MIHVAIENSVHCALALRTDTINASVTRESFGRNADSQFLPFLKEYLQGYGTTPEAVTHWSIGTGPGSFASIRFTLALVKGICTVTAAKSRGIPSFFITAKQMQSTIGKTGKVAVLMDARCGKLLLALYQMTQNACTLLQAPDLIDVADAKNIPCDFICTASEEILPILPQGTILLPPPDAVPLLDADEEAFPWLDTPDVEPVYVRPPA